MNRPFVVSAAQTNAWVSNKSCATRFHAMESCGTTEARDTPVTHEQSSRWAKNIELSVARISSSVCFLFVAMRHTNCSVELSNCAASAARAAPEGRPPPGPCVEAEDRAASAARAAPEDCAASAAGNEKTAPSPLSRLLSAKLSCTPSISQAYAYPPITVWVFPTSTVSNIIMTTFVTAGKLGIVLRYAKTPFGAGCSIGPIDRSIDTALRHGLTDRHHYKRAAKTRKPAATF